MNKKYKYLIKNISFFSLSSFATKFLSFLILPLYTYYLTQEEYALIDLLNLLITLLMPILTLGITDAFLRFLMDEEYNKDYIITITLTYIGASCLIVVIFVLIFCSIEKGKLLPIYFCIMYILSLFNIFYSNYMRAQDKVSTIAVVSFATSIVTILLNVIFITQMNMHVHGYFIANIIGISLGNIIYLYNSKIWKHLKIRALSSSLQFKMLAYSTPLIPNSLFWWINSSLDKFMMLHLCDLSYVGLYSVAGKIPSIISIISSLFQQAWTISAIKEIKKGEEFYRIVYDKFKNILVFFVIILMLCCKPIAPIIYQKDFYLAWQYVPILLITAYVSALNSFLGSIYIALNQTKSIFYTTGFGALINILLNLYLIPKYEGFGAAIATLFSTTAVWLVRYKKMYKFVASEYSWIKNVLILLFLILLALVIITL